MPQRHVGPHRAPPRRAGAGAPSPRAGAPAAAPRLTSAPRRSAPLSAPCPPPPPAATRFNPEHAPESRAPRGRARRPQPAAAGSCSAIPSKPGLPRARTGRGSSLRAHGSLHGPGSNPRAGKAGVCRAQRTPPRRPEPPASYRLLSCSLYPNLFAPAASSKPGGLSALPPAHPAPGTDVQRNHLILLQGSN